MFNLTNDVAAAGPEWVAAGLFFCAIGDATEALLRWRKSVDPFERCFLCAIEDDRP
jgi:hypothetical protein